MKDAEEVLNYKVESFLCFSVFSRRRISEKRYETCARSLHNTGMRLEWKSSWISSMYRTRQDDVKIYMYCNMTHYNMCFHLLQSHIQQCTTKSFLCKCGQRLPESVREKHLAEECPQRLVSCSYCNRRKAASNLAVSTSWPLQQA